MSLFPAIVTLLVVMLLAAASARISQDTGLAAAQRMDSHMARQRAEIALQHAAAALGTGEPVPSDALVEEVALCEQAELGDLPLVLQRVTATGYGHQARVRLQADYAVDGCESADEEPCLPRVRRIAWRELPD